MYNKIIINQQCYKIKGGVVMIFPDSFSPTFTLTEAEISFHKPIDFFAINESRDKNLEVLVHHHIFFEMIYVLKGSITHSINVTETTSISSGEYI